MNSKFTEGKDDKTLDRELTGLHAAYEKLDHDEPPGMLDQAILNSAHRAVDKKPRWLKFGWPQGLATTAVFVLAFSLILNQPETVQVQQNGIDYRTIQSKELEQKNAKQGLQSKSDDHDAAYNLQRKKQQLQAGDGSVKRSTTGLSNKDEVAIPSPASMAVDEANMAADMPLEEALNETAEVTPSAKSIATDLEKNVNIDPSLEQRLMTIIRMKEQGNSEWITELEVFRETWPDYPIPVELEQ